MRLELDITSQEAGDLTVSGIDLALRFEPQPASTMSSLHLLDTRVLTVAAPGYLARHGRPAGPDSLVDHMCLHYIDPHRGRRFDWEFHRGNKVRPVDVRGRYTFTDADTMIAVACAGVGIAQILALGTNSLLASGALVELFPDVPDESFPLYVIRPSRHLPSAAVVAFMNFCREICAGRQA